MYSSAEQSWAEEKNVNNFGNGLPSANSEDWPIFAGTEVKMSTKKKGNLRKLKKTCFFKRILDLILDLKSIDESM